MPIPTQGPLAVSRTRAAEMLDIKDKRIITRLIQQGKLKAMRVGGRYLINVGSIYQLLGYEDK